MMNSQAVSLNEILKKENEVVFDLLSKKGKEIFFPKKGILGQTADAKGTKINATIGTANNDDGSPMRLASIEKQLNIPPQEAFPYAPSYGNPLLRKKWQEMIVEKNPELKEIAISMPVVTNALTHGISILGYLFAEENETILVSDLFWGNYNLILNGGYNANLEKFKLFEDEKYNLEGFRNSIRKIESKKKVILLNFPNNPCGYTPTIDEVQSIVAILNEEAQQGNQLVVICDDAYFGLVYEEGIEKQSIFAYLANLHENILAVKVDGPTKEDYVWGFRVGFITYGIKGGNEAIYSVLQDKTAGAVRGNISNASSLSQNLLLHSYQSEHYIAEKKEKYDILKARFDKVKQVLQNNPQYNEFFKALPFNSGYFMCVELTATLDAEAIRNILIEKYQTGTIALNNVLRLAFSAVPENLIEEMFQNIYKACKDYANTK